MLTLEQLAQTLNDLRLEQSATRSPISGYWNEMSEWRKQEWRDAAVRFLALTARYP